MGLLDLLPKSAFGYKGAQPPPAPGNSGTSTLHYDYSINGIPAQNGTYPTPSVLDLNGQIPTVSATSPQLLPYIAHEPK